MAGKPNDALDGPDFEKQFDGEDPDDSDTAGANNDGTQEVGDAAPPAPAPAPKPAAPAAAPAAAEGDGADPGEDDGAAAPAPAPAAPPAPAAAPTPPADAPAAAPAADDEIVPYEPDAPAYVPLTPADAQAQLDAAEAARQAALDKYEAGDSTRDEYLKAEREARAIERRIETAQAQDQAVHLAQIQQANQQWATMRADAINALQREGLKATPENVAALDEQVQAWAGVAQSRKMEDGPGLKASKWALEKAVAALKVEKGITGRAAAPAPAPSAPAPAPAPAAPAKPTQAEAEAARKINRDAIPPSLAVAPLAADAAMPGNAKFAHLDVLEGSALERAVAKMSDADQAEYLER